MLIGAATLAAGCGGASSGNGSLSAQTLSRAGLFRHALAFAACMRGHGLPNFPDPTNKGGAVQETLTAGAGVDPNSPQFAAARNACRHLLPNKGVPGPSPGQGITPAQQADYLKAAGCMRTHGVLNFPDPTFQQNSVAFNSRTPIDTNTPQYESALTTCRKLIPAGLPYNSSP